MENARLRFLPFVYPQANGRGIRERQVYPLIMDKRPPKVNHHLMLKHNVRHNHHYCRVRSRYFVFNG
jgi:hypothetical protein